MKISWNWLNDYLSYDKLSVDDVSNILTSIGLEVERKENFESIKGGLENFFIGEVLSCEKHANADKLKVTEVDLGKILGVKKIVCGAPNVAKGQKVVVAIEGATIKIQDREPFLIKNAKIRGEESQGMICAEDELGMGTNHDGILVLADTAQVGMPAADYFNVYTDTIFEIGLTPNRTDAMCHRGVARDIAAAINMRGGYCEFIPDGKRSYITNCRKSLSSINIAVKTDKAPKFGGMVIQNIENKASPSWLKNSLLAIGESPKNLLVDLTNYILHDLGQPLHAYDFNKIKGNKIVVEELVDEIEIIALSGHNLKLMPGDIAIKDEETVIGVAGVIGSLSSCISEDTDSIFLEGAYFDSTSIRKTSQRLHLRSEAAIKFEKGIDPNGIVYALEKAEKILLSCAKDAKTGPMNFHEKTNFPNWDVMLTRKKLDMYAGLTIEKEKVDSILGSLGIEIKASDSLSWELSIPRFKNDVRREEDVIEEVLRIYGFNSLPYPKFLKSNLSFSNNQSKSEFEDYISNLLSGGGFQEIFTNSISQSKYFNEGIPIRLLNSMTSELDCMRLSLIPGFLEVIEYNLNREQKDLSLFELGNEYFMNQQGQFVQRRRLVFASTGMFENQNWQWSKGRPNDYFQLKSMVDKLFADLKMEVSFKDIQNSNYSYGLAIFINQREVGYLGELIWNGRLFDIKQKVFMADLDFNYIYEVHLRNKIVFKDVPKYPVVRRDLALVLDESICYDQLEGIAKKSIGKILMRMSLFDVFKDASLGKERKSYAVRYYFNSPDKTLLDKEIDDIMNTLLVSYKKELAAEIRS